MYKPFSNTFESLPDTDCRMLLYQPLSYSAVFHGIIALPSRLHATRDKLENCVPLLLSHLNVHLFKLIPWVKKYQRTSKMCVHMYYSLPIFVSGVFA